MNRLSAFVATKTTKKPQIDRLSASVPSWQQKTKATSLVPLWQKKLQYKPLYTLLNKWHIEIDEKPKPFAR